MLLKEVGIDYYAKKMVKEVTFGGISNKSLGYDKEAGFFIADSGELDAFGKSIGFQNFDVIKKWNGKPLTLDNINEVFGEFFNAAKPNLAFTVTVARGKEQKEEVLNAKVIEVDVEKEHVLELTPNPSLTQLEFRRWWLGDKTIMAKP